MESLAEGATQEMADVGTRSEEEVSKQLVLLRLWKKGQVLI